jgi:nitrite reductase (cytochrome c-552)
MVMVVAAGLALGIGAYILAAPTPSWRRRDFRRKAQFYLDFVEAENSTGFHAPQQAARILGESIDFTRQGQLALREGGKR